MEFPSFRRIGINTSCSPNTFNNVFKIKVFEEAVLGWRVEAVGIAEHKRMAGCLDAVAKLLQALLRKVIESLFCVVIEAGSIG